MFLFFKVLLIILLIVTAPFLLFVLAAAFLAIIPYRRPLHTESDLKTATPVLFHLYYSSKYLNLIRLPRKDSVFKDLFKTTRKPDNNISLKNKKRVVIKAVGDLMVRKEFALEKNSKLWNDVGDYLFDADITFGNLECAVNPNWIIEKTIRYSVPFSYVKPLLFAEPFGKFDIVATANNHINDSLSDGIKSTCDLLDENKIEHVGANRTKEEQDDIKILDVNGVKIAFLAYTFTTNGIPLEDNFKFGTNVVHFNALDESDYDPSLILKHIKIAKEKGADFIVSSHHWGIEFEYYPADRIIKRSHELMDAGIDLIIGHHPHILNLSEWYQTKDNRTALCFYSLGHLTKYAQLGPIKSKAAIAEIVIEKGESDDNKTITLINDAIITPTYFRLKKRKNGHEHRILPLLKFAELIKRGEKPSWLSYFDSLKILLNEWDFRKFLMQSGFKYK